MKGIFNDCDMRPPISNSQGEQMEDAIVEMREQLDAKEKEVRTQKPKLP